MKKTLIALAVLSASSLAMATSAFVPTTVTSGNNSVSGGSFSSSSVAGAGSSVSTAVNKQAASAWATGGGSLATQNAHKQVTLDNCVTKGFDGKLTTGSVTNRGAVTASGSSEAKNVSTGGGSGFAEAGGVSNSFVESKTTLASPNMNLVAGGVASVGVATGTSAGTNQTGLASNGSIAAGWHAGATGSLFTFNSGGYKGDVKDSTFTSSSFVGGIPTKVTNACGVSRCVNGPSISNNATVVGGANGYSNGSVTNSF